MKFYKQRHKYYCGIDLHAKTMYVCVVDSEGKVVKHRNIKSRPGDFLQAISKFREDIVVGVECMFCWYWLADLCAREGIPFVLGHALYMKAIHGGKAKNDKIDSEKIALLLRAGMLPQAYVYPAEMRATRDLMRRRLFFVRRRAELLSHIKMTYQQYNCHDNIGDLTYVKHREALMLPFTDPSVIRMIQGDVSMIGHFTKLIRELETHIYSSKFSKDEIGFNIALLKTIPGIGQVLSATIYYEIEDINRFPTVQDFVSYSRLVKPKKTSAGKTTGSGGKKIGNHHLRWAFSEAVMIHLRDDAQGKAYMQKLLKKHPKGKAMSIMAAKLARTVYFVLKRQQPFNQEKFFSMAA
jgi:transposase